MLRRMILTGKGVRPRAPLIGNRSWFEKKGARLNGPNSHIILSLIQDQAHCIDFDRPINLRRRRHLSL
jgi:hypothetical protein